MNRFAFWALAACTLLSFLTACATTDGAATSQPAKVAKANVRIRIASTKQRPGFVAMANRDGNSFYVSMRDELTEHDIHLARAYHAQNGNMVELILKPPAAARFSTLTRENLGSWIAFVVDEQLISVAMIQSEIQNGVAYISGLSADEAEKLATSLCAQEPKSDDPLRG